MPGTRLLYTAGTLSLATLEMLVNLGAEDLLSAYSFAEILFDEQMILPIERFSKITENWSDHPPPPAIQQIGTEWVSSMTSAVLKVPTVILPNEFNYLINIAHQDFSQLTLSDPKPFSFDKRLFKK